jgi:hypothetical protein
MAGLNADTTSKLRRACYKQVLELIDQKCTTYAKAMEPSVLW